MNFYYVLVSTFVFLNPDGTFSGVVTAPSHAGYMYKTLSDCEEQVEKHIDDGATLQRKHGTLVATYKRIVGIEEFKCISVMPFD